MIVNKSMFPLQTGFSVISKMQNQFATLQMQLGTGEKAQTLSEMGRDLPISLSVRSRLSTISAYNSNIEQVSLRLSFYDNALTRMDKIESEARNSAVQGQYGSSNINMATISSLSKARLDEMVTMLNADVAGRYLFGGNVTDKAPLPTSSELLDGAGSRAGFKAVVSERQMADFGADGLGRLETTRTALTAADPATVIVGEDGVHDFGFKLSPGSRVGTSIGWTENLATSPASVSFSFPAPPASVAAGDSVTIGLTLPDGEKTTVTMKAVARASDPPVPGEFEIGADAVVTSDNFQRALDKSLKQAADGELRAASTFIAAENFFNAAGEPVLRVDAGSPADPYSATGMRLATKTDTVMWYSGQSAAVSATGMGRLEAEQSGGTVTLTQKTPVSSAHGFAIDSVSSEAANAGAVSATRTAGPPAEMTVAFDAATDALSPNDKVTVTLKEPAPSTKSHAVTLTAVSGNAGPGQFSISTKAAAADRDAENAANFQAALVRSVTEAAVTAEGSPRQSMTAAVEDAGRVAYGMQANESGYLRMMRTMAAMTVETYPEVTSASDPNSSTLQPAKARFDAMARRQQLELSEGRNAERGSIEIITMELGVARAGLQSASDRHTNYKAQLDNLLSEVEMVSKEDVAMQILALQTRLSASYQTTAMVSQLSLVNFL